MRFIVEYGFSWDLLMVFPYTTQSTESPSSKPPDVIVNLIQSAGIETYLFYSVDQHEIICKLRVPPDRLMAHADQIDYRMLLDEEALKEVAEWGIPESNIKPIQIAHNPSVTKRNPHECIYARYDTDDRLMPLYKTATGHTHPFSAVHRIKILMDILQSPVGSKGCGLNLQALVDAGSLLAVFPLHSEKEREALRAAWLGVHIVPWKQPINSIRDYFGEKVGLYFAFLGHYTTWLVSLAICGTLVGLDVVAEMNVQAASAPFFAVVVAFWSVLMLEYWKRAEATLAMEWGMVGFEEEEHNRPEFTGESIQSFINGQDIKYFAPEQRLKHVFHSMGVIFFLILLVVAAVTSIFVLKIFLVDDVHDSTVNSMGASMASVANAIQIQVMNYIYSSIALWLTVKENHRTDTQFEDSLIAKLFAFQV